MTLPQPIVAYHKRAPGPQDPFGTWCKLHHAFFTHLAEARLSGAAYKVVLQVLCASFHFGQYHPAALSLEQFQSSQHLGRKAVIEGLRQAMARGILYEEQGWQAGAHTPKRYGLVFYRALVVDRGHEDDSAWRQGMTLLKGGAFSRSKPAPEPTDALSSKARSSSQIELHHEAGEDLETTAGAEIEPAPVLQPHQLQFANRTTPGALTEPEAAQQRRQEAASDVSQEDKERRDKEIPSASLMPPLEEADKGHVDLQEEKAAPFLQTTSAELHHLPSDHLADEIAALREEYERRQTALAAWRPHGVEQIQAKIAARLEVRRLEQDIEALEAALELQDQKTQEGEGIGAIDQPDKLHSEPPQHTSVSESPSVMPPLRVPEEQLAQWRAEVAAQRREVRRVQAQYQAVTDQLQHCHIGRGNWGTLMREQRFLAGELEEQEAELARYERFIALIEQGATKEEACELLLEQHHQEPPAEQGTFDDVSLSSVPSEELPPEPAPRLEGQKLRQALFTTLARLFTSGDPRHIDLERGKFNRAIKNLVSVNIQPEDVSVLKATFERLWPQATCTALGLANNLPILIDKAQMFGWQLR